MYAVGEICQLWWGENTAFFFTASIFKVTEGDPIFNRFTYFGDIKLICDLNLNETTGLPLNQQQSRFWFSNRYLVVQD